MSPQGNPAGQVLPAAAVPLRTELESGGERVRQAVLSYEIGHIVERDGQNDAQAVREYLGAYNLDPTFRPPLFALIRLFERRRSFKNLARLYDAEFKSATTGQERASALIDRAALLTDHLAQTEQEIALLEQAADEDGESTVAPLVLEWRARLLGDSEVLRAALQLRAGRTKDPVLKGMLLVELAAAKEAAGDVDGALETLRAAVRMPKERQRFLRALEATARRAGRAPELVAALEGQAALAAQAAAEGAVAGSALEATGLWLDAARARLVQLGDAEGARATLEKALSLLPDDVALLREHMLACDAAGDTEAAAADAARIVQVAFPEGGDVKKNRHAAPFLFRLAETAQISGDTALAIERLNQAAECAPDSAVVRGTLDDAALGSGDVEALLARLEAQAKTHAEAGRGDVARRAYVEAATWARDFARDRERAEALYDAALAVPGLEAPERVFLMRERLAATHELGDVAGGTGIQPIVDGALALAVAPGIDPSEQSAVLRMAYHAALSTPLEQASRRRRRVRAVLAVALEQAEARTAWAADAARLFAAASLEQTLAAPPENAAEALEEDVNLLSRAHRALAEQSESADLAAAHYCAAARGAVRGRREDEAIELLRLAVARVPSHRYAITLLEEIYRRRGDVDAVVRILREAAAEDTTGRALVGQLLSAGAAAEGAGDRQGAAKTYRDAHQRDPDAEGPILALRRLAERAEADGNSTLIRGLLEDAAARDERIANAPSAPDAAPRVPWPSLELGERMLLAGSADAAIPLRRALKAEGTRTSAALALALSSDPQARLDGVRALVEPTGAAPAVLREQLTLADALGAGVSDGEGASGPSADALDAADALLARDRNDRLALLSKLWRAPVGSPGRPAALYALADATDDGRLAAELTLAGMRAGTALALAGEGEEGDDDHTLRAAEIADRAPEALEAALAYAEAFGDVDDAGERAEAIARFLPLLDGSGFSPDEASSLRAEHARALVAAGRADEALETLAELTEDPDDLAAFETLRVAAREVGAYRLVVISCDRLAQATVGEVRAQLLEEAAAVLMDHLEVDSEAEPRLRAALAVDPRRPIAYARLHDMLAERGDDAGLLELLEARIEVTDDPAELAPLFYEEARFRRAFNQREEALAALDNLFLLESEHVGGLALLVELHVQGESWAEAVDALRRLASAADVPAGQRRIARLGAADFLEKRLRDPAGAIAELEAIEALGLGDRALFERMAAIHERAGDLDAALAVLNKGVQLATEPADRATLFRKRGILLERRGDLQLAVGAFRGALSAAPLDVAAAEALGKLVAPEERKLIGQKLEDAARGALGPDPSEPSLLRTLRMAAALRGDATLEHAVLGALAAGRMADVEEARAAAPVPLELRSGALLSDALLAKLRLDADSETALELADLANEALLELDRFEASNFGVGRPELVRGPSPMDGMVRLVTALGAAPAELYVGGQDPGATIGVSHRGKPLWVFGANVQANPSRASFISAQLALGLRLGVSPIVWRLVREGLDAAIDALLATSAAAGSPLAYAAGRGGVDALSARLSKVVSRRVRRAAPDVAARIGDGRTVAVYVRALRGTLLRVAAVAADDLSPALDAVAGGAARTERSTRENADARELLRYWVSPLAASLRTELTGR